MVVGTAVARLCRVLREAIGTAEGVPSYLDLLEAADVPQRPQEAIAGHRAGPRRNTGRGLLLPHTVPSVVQGRRRAAPGAPPSGPA